MLEIVATLLTLAGFYVLGYDPDLGYMIAGAGNIAWMRIGYLKKMNGLMILNCVMLGIALGHYWEMV